MLANTPWILPRLRRRRFDGALVAQIKVFQAAVSSDSVALQAVLKRLAAGELVSLPDPNAVPGLTDPDDVPEPPDQPLTRAGDLWTLGQHRLLCGDSAKPEDIDRLLAGALQSGASGHPTTLSANRAQPRVDAPLGAFMKPATFRIR
jgi:hypothetical protein